MRAQVEADDGLDGRSPMALDQRVGLVERERQRLLDEHVLAGLDRRDRHLHVSAGRHADGHRLDGGVLGQLARRSRSGARSRSGLPRAWRPSRPRRPRPPRSARTSRTSVGRCRCSAAKPHPTNPMRTAPTAVSLAWIAVTRAGCIFERSRARHAPFWRTRRAAGHSLGSRARPAHADAAASRRRARRARAGRRPGALRPRPAAGREVADRALRPGRGLPAARGAGARSPGRGARAQRRVRRGALPAGHDRGGQRPERGERAEDDHREHGLPAAADPARLGAHGVRGLRAEPRARRRS